MPVTLPIGLYGRLLALGITLVTLILLWLFLAVPLMSLYDSRTAEIQQRQTILQHMEVLAALLPDLQSRASVAAQSGPPPVMTIEGSSDAVAAANLQKAVQDMASTAGANLSSVEIVQATTVSGYRRIGLKLSLNASWPVLVSLLRSMQQSTPPMLVDDLEIHATPSAVNGFDHALDASLAVYAFRSIDPSEAPS